MRYEVIEGVHVVYDEEKGQYQGEYNTEKEALSFAVDMYNKRISSEDHLKHIIKSLEEEIESYKSPKFKELESISAYQSQEQRELRT